MSNDEMRERFVVTGEPLEFEDLAERLERFGVLSIEGDGSTYLFEAMTPAGEDYIIEGNLARRRLGSG